MEALLKNGFRVPLPSARGYCLSNAQKRGFSEKSLFYSKTIRSPRLPAPPLSRGAGGIEPEMLLFYPDGQAFTSYNQEKQRAERLANKLRELGLNPDEI